MNYPLVIHEQQRPRLFHREANPRGTVRIEDARFAATNIPPLNQQQRNEIDPIPVRTLWRGPADSIGGIDPELMGFDEPAFHRAYLRKDRADGLTPGVSIPERSKSLAQQARTNARDHRAARCRTSAASEPDEEPA